MTDLNQDMKNHESNTGQQTNTQDQYTSQSNTYHTYSPTDIPENYMTMSIIATVVGFLSCCFSCCIPGIIGAIAIVFSAQVNTKCISGDLAGAMSSAKTAKILGIISLGITGVAFLGRIIYFAIVFSTVGLDVFLGQYQEILDTILENVQ